MIEVSELRKRLLRTIQDAKRLGAERRRQRDEAAGAYEAFHQQIAVPVFRMFSTALRAEGYPFALVTPEGSVRLVREPSGDFIALELDTSRMPPAVAGRSRRSVGGDVVSNERPVGGEGKPIEAITDEDVVQFVLDEIAPFIER